MAIESPCEECGQKYAVGDHLAGKRFQCKKCGNTVTVPFPPRPSRPASAPPVPRRSAASEPSAAPPPPASRPSTRGAIPSRPLSLKKPSEDPPVAPSPARRAAKPKKTSEDDPWDDLIEDQGEPIEEPEEEKPAPKKKKKKKARSSSGGGGSGLAVGGLGAGGVLIACVLIRLAIKFGPTMAIFAPGTAEWRVWKHPTQPVQIEMPAAPKSMFKDGQQIYAAEVRRRFACSVGCVNLPPHTIGIPLDRMADEVMNNIDSGLKSGSKITARKRIEYQGFPGVEFEGRIEGNDNIARLIVMPGRLVALEFAFDKTDYPAERARFFDSLKLN